MMLGFGILGLLTMVLIFGALIVGSLWLVRGLFPRSPEHGGSQGQNARELLDERYARGEISRAEYETIRQDLQV